MTDSLSALMFRCFQQHMNMALFLDHVSSDKTYWIMTSPKKHHNRIMNQFVDVFVSTSTLHPVFSVWQQQRNWP